jgi:hypothetical protein
MGQLRATKRPDGHGTSKLWSIAAAEVAPYKNEGLLPVDPERNR